MKLDINLRWLSSAFHKINEYLTRQVHACISLSILRTIAEVKCENLSNQYYYI